MATYGFDMSEVGETVGKYTGNKIADEVNNTLNNALDKATSAVDGVIAGIENELDAILVKGIDWYYNQLGISDALEFANNILGTGSNIISKVDSILSLIPNDISFAPSFKASLTPLTTSLKDMALSMWKELQALYNELINAVITAIGSPIEILCGMVTTLVEWIENYIDSVCFKYTGYHILEIYNMCIKGIQLVKTIKACYDINKASSTGAGYSANVDIDVTIDTDTYKKQLYALLYSYMEGLTTPLYNAFLMLQMKDTVLLIKDFVSKMTNISLKELARNIQNIDDVVAIFDHILSMDPIYVSIEEIKELGLNNITLAYNQLQKAAENATNTDVLGSAQSTIAGATSMINVSTSVTASKQYTFEMDLSKTEETGNYYIIATLYVNPSKCIKKINNSLKNVKINNELVFSSAAINNIISALKDAWNKAQDSELSVAGMLDGSSRTYIFVIKPLNNGKTENTELTTTNTTNSSGSSDSTDNSSTDNTDSADNTSTYNTTDETTDDSEELLSKLSLESLVVNYRAETSSNNIILFDIVGTLINTIKSTIEPVIEKIAELISNYKINKEKVQTHASGNLGISFAGVLAKLTGDTDISEDDSSTSTDSSATDDTTTSNNSHRTSKTLIVDTNSLNFYTVRSSILYNYLTINIGLIPDNTLMATSTIEQTAEILDNAPVDISLTVVEGKETVFYFDTNSINGNLTNKDGSYTNLTDINRDPNSKKVYVNISGKPYESSQILLLQSKGY